MSSLCFLFGELSLASAAFAQDSSSIHLAQRNARYAIQPNDVVEVQFRYTPEYNFTATVQPDGFVSSQITGDVHIGGLTIPEASSAIAKAASTRLKDPDVGVVLKDFVKPHFVVAGEVAHPGTYELRGDVGIIQAIAMSGGFVRESAKRTQVILVRKASGDLAEVKLFNLKKLMSEKNILEDISLKPDDLLVVPQNGISKLQPYMQLSNLGLYGITYGLR